jgi:hypothetical protein
MSDKPETWTDEATDETLARVSLSSYADDARAYGLAAVYPRSTEFIRGRRSPEIMREYQSSQMRQGGAKILFMGLDVGRGPPSVHIHIADDRDA